MGHPLFERSAQGVALTPFGEAVIGLIEDAVAATDEASARTFVLMAPMCGLSVFTEAFFRSAARTQPRARVGINIPPARP